MISWWFWSHLVRTKLFKLDKISNLSQESQDAIKRIIDAEGSKAFRELASQTLKQQGINWMALFKLNNEGFELINAAKSKIDSVMCNLGQIDDDGKSLSNEVYNEFIISNDE